MAQSKNEKTSKCTMIELRHTEDLEQLLQRSNTDPVFIFKHSTQCSISAHACHEFQKFLNGTQDLVSGIVLVIENRSLSNTVASRLGVRHESPQAILVKGHQPVWWASHWSITAQALEEALKG
jgi:bacillithiol system protein YtxJ